MNNFTGSAFVILFMIAACRENTPSVVKPRGLDLANLPTVSVAQAFPFTEGHYAELVQQNGDWQAYINGKSEGILKNSNEQFDFLKSFKDISDENGNESTILISANENSKSSEIQALIRNVASVGIQKPHFLVHSANDGKKSFYYQALLLDLGCLHCRLNGFNHNPQPLEITLSKDNSILIRDGDSMVKFDSSSIDNDPTIFDDNLNDYANRVRDQNSSPLIRVILDPDTKYQRFIDVLSKLNIRNLEAEFSEPENP